MDEKDARRVVPGRIERLRHYAGVGLSPQGVHLRILMGGNAKTWAIYLTVFVIAWVLLNCAGCFGFFGG